MQTTKKVQVPGIIYASFQANLSTDGHRFAVGVLNLLVSNRIFPPLYRGTTPDGYEHLVSEGAVESGALKAQEFKDQYREVY